MTPQAAKAKGRRLQKYVAAKILEFFPHLTTRDVASTSMGANGVDVKLSQAAYDCVPLSIECKNREINKAMLDAWKQADQKDLSTPIFVLTANNSPILALIDLDTLLNLYKEIHVRKNGTG